MWTAIAPPPGKFCFEYDLSIQFVLFTNLYAPIRVLSRIGAFYINLSDLLLIFRRMEPKKRNGVDNKKKNLYNYSENRKKRLSLIDMS